MSKSELAKLAKIEQKLEDVVNGQLRLEQKLEKYCERQEVYNKQVVTSTEQLRKLSVNHDRIQAEKIEQMRVEKSWSVQRLLATWSIMTAAISTAVSLLVSYLNGGR